jgi:iron(III) transport system substrate-binding protein
MAFIARSARCSGLRRAAWFALACALLLPCAPLRWNAPAFAQPNGTAALATYLGADRERLLIDGAKQEGELTLYSSMQLDSITPLQKAFESKYGVRIRIWRGSGKDILRRVVTEAAANRNDVDVMESDSFALEALYREDLLQTVNSPYLADLIPEALRPQGQWVGTRFNIVAGVYNTTLDQGEKWQKLYADMLNSR